MLSDPLVTGRSEWRSRLLARNIIAPFRLPVLQKVSISLAERGTHHIPLQYYMRKLAQALETAKGIPVEVAMRYGDPTFATAVRELERKCPLLHEVIIFPLYPHYAQSTTQTAFEDIGKQFYKRPHSFRLKFVEPYFDHPAYIQALAERSAPYLEDIDRLVFSYHSLPVAQVEAAWRKGKEFDYVYQAKETNRLFCEEVGFDLRRTFLFIHRNVTITG